jgi:hypothetical protein
MKLFLAASVVCQPLNRPPPLVGRSRIRWIRQEVKKMTQSPECAYGFLRVHLSGHLARTVCKR